MDHGRDTADNGSAKQRSDIVLMPIKDGAADSNLDAKAQRTSEERPVPSPQRLEKFAPCDDHGQAGKVEGFGEREHVSPRPSAQARSRALAETRAVVAVR